MNEWENEPNALDGETDGLRWFIRRSSFTGALCGYVEFPVNSVDDFRSSVHGGITYSGEGFDGMPPHVIGFDCSHPNDFCPNILLSGDEVLSFARHTIYRNISYVKEQVFLLIKEIIAERSYPIIFPYGEMAYDDHDHYLENGGFYSLTGIAFMDEQQAVYARLSAP